GFTILENRDTDPNILCFLHDTGLMEFSKVVVALWMAYLHTCPFESRVTE
ncbi:hypothetical protein WUBG_01834, partial [Wuchereria bancrofti]